MDPKQIKREYFPIVFPGTMSSASNPIRIISGSLFDLCTIHKYFFVLHWCFFLSALSRRVSFMNVNFSNGLTLEFEDFKFLVLFLHHFSASHLCLNRILFME